MKYRKYKPYIRKIKPADKSESIRTAYRMAYYKVTEKPAYGLFQYGFRNLVCEVEGSKKDLKDRVLFKEKYRDWQKKVKNFAVNL